MQDDTLLRCLAAVCRKAREDGGLDLADITTEFPRPYPYPSTISNFERAKAWPKHPEQTVNAYAAALDELPITLWQRALDMWGRGLPDPLVPLPPEGREPDD